MPLQTMCLKRHKSLAWTKQRSPSDPLFFPWKSRLWINQETSLILFHSDEKYCCGYGSLWEWGQGVAWARDWSLCYTDLPAKEIVCFFWQVEPTVPLQIILHVFSPKASGSLNKTILGHCPGSQSISLYCMLLYQYLPLLQF